MPSALWTAPRPWLTAVTVVGRTGCDIRRPLVNRLNVAPRVGFGHSGSRYTARVASDLSYAGHYVWVQRKSPYGSFRNVKRIYLGASSRAVFTLHLVKGRSILRLVLPDTQVGVGYVASSSRTISVVRH